ncbi:MAG: BlaI/MecI/CopY family transcriptional regulator [Candidatus Sumerlaeia bacterium]
MINLTPGEIEVMKVLWERGGEMSPPEIEEKFPRPIKNAALRFQLKILLEKGHVTRRRVGKAYFYKAVTPRQRTFKSMARRMAEIFFAGSTAGLIAELIKTENLSDKEIQELEQLAKGKKSH